MGDISMPQTILKINAATTQHISVPPSVWWHIPPVPPPPWHAPNTSNVQTLADWLKLTAWGLQGCKLKPPLSDVDH